MVSIHLPRRDSSASLIIAQSTIATFPSPSAIFTVDCIQSKAGFDHLQIHWQDIHLKDKYSTVFSDWNWVSGYFEVTSDMPCVLAVRCHDPSSEVINSYVGFMALKIRTIKALGIPIERSLEMLGNPNADYSSFVCLPEYESLFIEACANYVVHHLTWHSLAFTDVLDPRLDEFIERINKLDSNFRSMIIPGSVSPFVSLPRDWDTYIKQTVPKSYRRKLRNAVKRLEEEKSLQWVMADSSNFEVNLQHFFRLHRSQWNTYTDENQSRYATFYQHCFETGILRLSVLYHEHTPISADLCFFDAKQKSLAVYGRSHDHAFSQLSPGHVNLCRVMQSAIEEGLDFFDFLRGDEGYKAIFGPEERWTRHGIVFRSKRSRVRMQVLNAVRKSETLKQWRDRWVAFRKNSLL